MYERFIKFLDERGKLINKDSGPDGYFYMYSDGTPVMALIEDYESRKVALKKLESFTFMETKRNTKRLQLIEKNNETKEKGKDNE
jgi:hypothetical protein